MFFSGTRGVHEDRYVSFCLDQFRKITFYSVYLSRQISDFGVSMTLVPSPVTPPSDG